jgi:hypothetical protein
MNKRGEALMVCVFGYVNGMEEGPFGRNEVFFYASRLAGMGVHFG